MLRSKRCCCQAQTAYMRSAALLHSLHTHCTIHMFVYGWRFPSMTSNTSGIIVSTFPTLRHDCLPVDRPNTPTLYFCCCCNKPAFCSFATDPPGSVLQCWCSWAYIGVHNSKLLKSTTVLHVGTTSALLVCHSHATLLLPQPKCCALAICCPLRQFPALWGNLLSPGNSLL